MRKVLLIGWALVGALMGGNAVAQDASAVAIAGLTVGLDTLWVLVAAALVFFMQAGFALLEAGLQSAKNVVNILMKNYADFIIASLAFWAVGFAFMFGDGNSILGLNGWFLQGPDTSPLTYDAYSGIFGALSWTGVPLAAKFIFQLVFAGTAATIVSGAVGGRVKFPAYLIFSLVMTALIYPILGHWVWGGGWLASLDTPFLDFAGSTVVHAVGGFAALGAVLVLGPRIGRYAGNKVNAMPGHNMTIAALGVFILWLGWFGFNPGSTMGHYERPRFGRAHILNDEPRGCCGRGGGFDGIVGALRQTRLFDDDERCVGRTRRHHRAVRVRRAAGRAYYRRGGWGSGVLGHLGARPQQD